MPYFDDPFENTSKNVVFGKVRLSFSDVKVM